MRVYDASRRTTTSVCSCARPDATFPRTITDLHAQIHAPDPRRRTARAKSLIWADDRPKLRFHAAVEASRLSLRARRREVEVLFSLRWHVIGSDESIIDPLIANDVERFALYRYTSPRE